MRQRALAAVATALLLVALSGASAAQAAWQDPQCEEDSSPRAESTFCIPPGDVDQPPDEANTCAGSEYCELTYAQLEDLGFGSSGLQVEDAEAAQTVDAAVPTRPEPTAASRTFYGAWVSFYLYNGKRCAGTVKDNGHCGWLFHKYRVYVSGTPKPGIYVTAYPARSGNDAPSDEWHPGLGPIPDRFKASSGGPVRDEYRWGRMNGSFTGFESDSSDSFYPGKWRLDPWVIHKPTNTNVTRSSFEIHGGRNGDGSSRLWTTRTNGCIRLSIAGVRGLKGKWSNRTDNRKQARVYVVHNA
jgi:hypothetical protein